jgi:hypothetical protein
MTERYFLNGKLIIKNVQPFFRIIKGIYWGLNISRISRLLDSYRIYAVYFFYVSAEERENIKKKIGLCCSKL